MFLSRLNPTEKDCFIKLAVAIMKADGCVEKVKNDFLSVYTKELQLPTLNLEEQYNINPIIEELAKNSTIQNKRIIFLELLALALVDGEYAIEEKTILGQLIKAFGLEPSFVEQAINTEDAYISTYLTIVDLIEKGE